MDLKIDADDAIANDGSPGPGACAALDPGAEGALRR
jgi:hypothetical protein